MNNRTTIRVLNNNKATIRVLNNNKVVAGGTRIIFLEFGDIYAERRCKTAQNGSTMAQIFQNTLCKPKFRPFRLTRRPSADGILAGMTLNNVDNNKYFEQ